MGAGAFIEPGVVIFLLFGGTYINRNTRYRLRWRPSHQRHSKTDILDVHEEQSPRSTSSLDARSTDSLLEDDEPSGASSPSLLPVHGQEPKWRKRELRILGWRKDLTTPNTKIFRERLLSRLLQKFPFLVEAWYWVLIYWVYQLGRAFTAVTMVRGTVNIAREHALQLVHLEQKLHIFWEPAFQNLFLRHESLMHWINRIYSFIHIPGTILFLVFLYWYTTSRNRVLEYQAPGVINRAKRRGEVAGSPAGPALYEARRRTMATCNLIAFIVFTLWPCMPPRLLSDPDYTGPNAKEARSYGFVDTVHGKGGESSVWTQNKFCNQYAAMPSLHFGYSLLIGLTIMTIPLAPRHRGKTTRLGGKFNVRLPSAARIACVAVGIAYPAIILIAIVATANHFILDAVAGACVCAVAWRGNGVLLNLLALEDYFLWCLRLHKPTPGVVDWEEGGEESEEEEVVRGKGVIA